MVSQARAQARANPEEQPDLLQRFVRGRARALRSDPGGGEGEGGGRVGTLAGKRGQPGRSPQISSFVVLRGLDPRIQGFGATTIQATPSPTLPRADARERGPSAQSSTGAPLSRASARGRVGRGLLVGSANLLACGVRAVDRQSPAQPQPPRSALARLSAAALSPSLRARSEFSYNRIPRTRSSAG